jgi:hypothetical protein
MILKWIFKTVDGDMWTGLIWLRGQLAGCCKCGNEPSVFHKMRGISCVAENRLASQERLLHVVG